MLLPCQARFGVHALPASFGANSSARPVEAAGAELAATWPGAEAVVRLTAPKRFTTRTTLTSAASATPICVRRVCLTHHASTTN